ncbi:MAG: hypothetical protein AB7G15_01285 [Alphaproteobacteria bacterium]
MRATWVIFAALIFVTPAAAEFDLDASAVKRITNRSEMARAQNVVEECARKSGKSWPQLRDCIATAKQAENRSNTDTDAFLLGLYVAELTELHPLAEEVLDSVIGAEVIREMRLIASLADSLQSLLGASDAQVAGLMYMRPVLWRQLVERWSK